MDITINLNNVQEGKKYLLEFCIREDGKEVSSSDEKKPKKVVDETIKKEKKKEKGSSIEDFVDDEMKTFQNAGGKLVVESSIDL